MKRNIPLSVILRSFFIGLFVLFIGLQSAFAAIVQVGSEQTAYGAGVQTISVNRPTGVTIGDVLIINVVYGGNGATNIPSVQTDGSSWTVLSSELSGGTGYRGAILYKVVTNTWETSYTITISNWPIALYCEASIVAFRGVDPTNPIDAIGNFTTTSDVSGTTINPTGITTVSPNALVVILGMSYRSDNNNERTFTSWVANSPAVFNELYDYRGGRRVAVGAATAIKTSPGATGDGTITLSGDNTYRGAIMLALRPEPAGPEISVVPSSLDFAYVASGGTSGEQTFVTSGTNLNPATGNITVTSPAGFEVSKTPGSGFASSVQVAYSGSTLDNTTIYVRFSPTGSPTNYSGNISNTGGSATLKNVAVTGTSILSYCTPSVLTTGWNAGIMRVVFNTIDNSTTAAVGYRDYTVTQSTSVTQGEAYDINVYVNTDGNYRLNQKVWIDWNQDGVFNTTDGSSGGMGEEYTLGTRTNVTNGLSSLCPLSITIPNGATLGNTRLRVSSLYNVYSISCPTSPDWAEFEDYTINVVASCVAVGNPAVWGNNVWNVYAYQGNNIDLSGITYKGYYTESNFSFSTQDRWNLNGSPSDANNYQGCTVTVDNHTFVYKREGFPIGTYQITIGHDDGYQLYIDNSLVSSSPTWDSNTPVVLSTIYPLNGTSQIEFRIAENAGGSSGSLTFTPQCANPTDGGTITNDQTICSGDDPVTFTSSSPVTGYTGTLEYKWQYSETASTGPWTDIASSNSDIYAASALTATTWYQRVARVSCEPDWTGAVPSNVLKMTVNPLPTAFNVTGGGSYCSGSSNVAVGLSGSQIGVTYQLYNGVNAVGSSVAGTGFALDFGNQTVSGTYTVVATDQSALCPRNMSGNATIVALPIADFSAAITNATCPNSSDGSIIPDNRIDPAIEFVNSDQDFIDLGSTLLSNRAAFTIEGWVKFNKADLGSRMSLFGQNDAIEFGFSDPTTIMCWTASGGSVSVPISFYPNDNGWHHVAVVGNGTNLLLYLDGTNVATGGNTTSNYGNDNNFSSKIGGGVWDGTGGWFNGQIKKVGFWSTALDQSEIATLSSGSAFYLGTEPGIIAGYNFYEGSGNSIGSLPSGNSGNFVNSPSWVDVVSYTWTKTGEESFNQTTKNISGLTPGEYNLTVSNGICTKSNSFYVSPDNPATIISIQSTDGQSQCIGGAFNAITVTASGYGILNYQWYRNITASASGGISLGSGNGAQTSSYTPQASETGTSYYYCEVSADCGITTSAVSGAFIVSALPNAPIAGSNTFTYDGSLITASASVGANETIDWYANLTGSTTSSVPSGTNVGTYTAYAETRNTNTGCVSATRTLVTFTIEKTNSTITATGTTTLTYTGLEQGPATSTVTGSNGAVTYSYSGTGSTTYGPVATLPIDAGTYQVIATVDADANYNGAVSVALPFTINKAVLAITADNQTVVFGTPIATVTGAGSFTPTGFVNSETSAVIGGIAIYTTTYTETTVAGTAGVTITPEVSGLTATNYSFIPVNGTMTIDKANSTITVTGTTTFTYTGLEQGPATSTVTGSTGAVTYNYSGTGTTTYGPVATLPIDAGTYQVIATVDTDENYNGAVSEAYEFMINRLALTITAIDQTKCVGTLFSFTGTEFTSVGLTNSDEVSSVTLTSAGSLADATEGIYNIVPNDAVGTGLNNYEITYSTDGMLTVNILPTGTLSNSGAVCSGSGTSLTFNKTAGTGPFDLVINGETYTDIASGGTISISQLTLSTTYNLTSIIDKGVSPNCPNVVDVSTTVAVYPIEVNATIGESLSCYSTLKDAFDKINDGTHQGDITIKVHESTTETVLASLYASGAGSANYSSVLIYPTVSGLSVSGTLNSALIDFNGADNVTIDGRINGIGDSRSLSINNLSTGTSVSTILFRNAAENNIIRDCVVSSSSRATTQGGTVFFSTATTGNGNSFNTIMNCDITTSDNVNPANRPMNSLYSSGSSGFENKNNTISNNNFYNFFRSAAHSYGINVLSNSSGWTLSNNSFYETTTFTASGNFTYRSIFLNGATVLGFNIDSNYIGGSAPSCGGSPWTIAEGGLTVFNGIDISAVGTTATTSVQNNIIQNIDLSTLTLSTAVAFRGIYTAAGTVNIIGNTIGELNSNGSIKVRAVAASGTTLVNAIQSASVADVTIQNNNIGSVNFDGGASNVLTFNGIIASGAAGSFTISGNTIGSASTANSIAIGTSGVTTVACTFVGIASAGTGINSVVDNTIQNVTTYGTGASTIQAINCSGNPSGTGIESTRNIIENKILFLSNYGTGILRGISSTGGTATIPLGIININSLCD